MFKRLIYLISAIALAFSFAACGSQTASTPTAAAGTTAPTVEPTTSDEPLVLRVGWLGKPDTLNPAYAFLTESYIIFELIYSPLTTESPSGEYVGALAKDWSHTEDGLVWTFTLKDNIKWHTGEALTAADVAWSINAVINNPDGWAALSGYVSGFTGAEALDEKTVKITLEAPIGNMEYRLSFLYAMYPKDFESFTTVEDLQNFANDAAIGTGAFKINRFDKDQGVLILDANPDYFDGAPIIDQVVFQTFDNSDAMVQALKVGDVDMVTEVPQSAFKTVQGYANVQAVQQPGRYLAELIINSASAEHNPTANPALADPQVKLALALAINKQDLVDLVLQGLGTPATTIVPPTLGGGFWHNSDIQEISFDLEKARQTLDAAGYVPGNDGIREKDGVRLEFRLQYPSDNPLYPRVADLMTGWFQEIGVKTLPESVDPDSLTALCCPAADFDLILWGWGPDPDPDFILSVLTTDQFVDGGWSDSGYSNPEYDQLYIDQQVAVDQNERQSIIWRMQELAFNDRPYIVYWYEDLLQAYRTDRFTGFIESPLGIETTFSLMQVRPVK